MAYNATIGDAVRRWLSAAGKTYRQVAIEASLAGTSVSPAYLADIVQGRVPSRDILVAVARVTAAPIEEVDAVLASVGYAPLTQEPHPAALFWDEVRKINEETGAGIQVYLHEGSANLTAERVRGYVRAIRNTLKEEGLLPQKGEP